MAASLQPQGTGALSPGFPGSPVGGGAVKIEKYVNTFMGFTFTFAGGGGFAFHPQLERAADTASGIKRIFVKFFPLLIPLVAV